MENKFIIFMREFKYGNFNRAPRGCFTCEAGLARLTEAPGYIVITFAKRIQFTWKAGPGLAGISLEQTGTKFSHINYSSRASPVNRAEKSKRKKNTWYAMWWWFNTITDKRTVYFCKQNRKTNNIINVGNKISLFILFSVFLPKTFVYANSNRISARLAGLNT